MAQNESEQLREAYEKRKKKGLGTLYSVYKAGTLYMIQQRERILLSMLKDTIGDLSDKRILDIGCGTGNTLIPFLLYGAQPKNCFGVDILPDRINTAKERLPGMSFAFCSAENLPFEKKTFDLVTMFTCLSSVLDSKIRRQICAEAFAMLRPGGWILIYDFTVNNPSNPDVRRVRLNELKEYFSGCRYVSKKLTLLPPLARAVGSYSFAFYCMLSAIGPLKTHKMTMFQKSHL